MITFYCACFAKSSVIWIPLLYIGTSTQFQFSLVNLNAPIYQIDSNPAENGVARLLDIVCNDDGSIVIRAINQSSVKTIPSRMNTKICNV